MANKQAALKPDSPPLQDYQRRVADRVNSDSPRLLVWHGTGLGKSRAAITAAEQAGSPYVAITPASLKGNFAKEQARWADGTTPSNVMSYTALGSGKTPTVDPGTVIFDEAARLRNPDSAQTRAATELAAKAKRVLLLTGTPISNTPGDLAPLVNILAGTTYTPASFEKRFVGTAAEPRGLFGWLAGVEKQYHPAVQHAEELEHLLKNRVDYQPSKNPEGVTTHDRTVDVDLDTDQDRFNRDLLGKLPWLSRMRLRHNYPMSDADMKKLRSFLVGSRESGLSLAQFGGGTPLEAFQGSGKLRVAGEHLMKHLEDPRHKALVFSQFIDAGLRPYEAFLASKNIPHALFHGGLSDAQRKQVVDDYNVGKIRALLLGPSAAEGISTKGTGLVQMLDEPFNEARMRQSRGRALRFDSHVGLPADLRNVDVERYIAHSPRPGFLGRLMGRTAEPTADEVLSRLSARKEETNKMFLELLQRVGSEKSGGFVGEVARRFGTGARWSARNMGQRIGPNAAGLIGGGLLTAGELAGGLGGDTLTSRLALGAINSGLGLAASNPRFFTKAKSIGPLGVGLGQRSLRPLRIAGAISGGAAAPAASKLLGTSQHFADTVNRSFEENQGSLANVAADPVGFAMRPAIDEVKKTELWRAGSDPMKYLQEPANKEFLKSLISNVAMGSAGGTIGAGVGGALAGLGGGFLAPDDERLTYEKRRSRERMRQLLGLAGVLGGGAAGWYGAQAYGPQLLGKEGGSVIDDLKAAKRHSDRRDYGAKHRVLRELLRSRPGEFRIDSRRGGFVGITHDSGFRIHFPARYLPAGVRSQVDGDEIQDQREDGASDTGSDRRGVRAADSSGLFTLRGATGREWKTGQATSHVDLSLYVRTGSNDLQRCVSSRGYKVLRLSVSGGCRPALSNARCYKESSRGKGVSSLGRDEEAMRRSEEAELQGLRRSGYNLLRPLEELRMLPGRHGSMSGRLVAGQEGYRRKLHSGQLPLGDSVDAEPEQTKQSSAHLEWDDAVCGGVGGNAGLSRQCAVQPSEQGGMVNRGDCDDAGSKTRGDKLAALVAGLPAAALYEALRRRRKPRAAAPKPAPTPEAPAEPGPDEVLRSLVMARRARRSKVAADPTGLGDLPASPVHPRYPTPVATAAKPNPVPAVSTLGQPGRPRPSLGEPYYPAERPIRPAARPPATPAGRDPFAMIGLGHRPEISPIPSSGYNRPFSAAMNAWTNQGRAGVPSAIGSAYPALESNFPMLGARPGAADALAERLHGVDVRAKLTTDAVRQGYPANTITPASADMFASAWRGLPPSEAPPGMINQPAYGPKSNVIATDNLTKFTDTKNPFVANYSKWAPRLLDKSKQQNFVGMPSTTLDPLGVLRHELEHAKQSPYTADGPPVVPAEYNTETPEIPTSLGDLPYTAELYRRHMGRDLHAPVEVAPGVTHDAAWMADQARRHGFFGGRSMTELLATPSGKQYLNRLLDASEPPTGMQKGSSLLESLTAGVKSARSRREQGADWAAVPGDVVTRIKLGIGPIEAVQGAMGGPNALTNSLVYGAMGAGLGYGGGLLAEHLAGGILPEGSIRKGRGRRTGALLGGLAGAALGPLHWHVANSAPGSPTYNDRVGSLTTDWPWGPNDIDKAAEYLERAMPETSPPFAKAADAFGLGETGALFTPSIPVDAFGNAVWLDVEHAPNPYGTRDPYGDNSQPMRFTPPQVAAAATGAVAAAGAMRGSNVVSPWDVALAAGAAAGKGYLGGLVLGKTVGALAGLTPEAQRAVRQAGLWGGLLSGAVGAVFGE